MRDEEQQETRAGTSSRRLSADVIGSISGQRELRAFHPETET